VEPAKVNAVLEPLEWSATDSAMAVRLLDTIGASWMSQAICVAAELQIPDLSANGSQTLDELVIKTQCPHASLHRLLRGLASLGICSEQRDASCSLTLLGRGTRCHHPRQLPPCDVEAGEAGAHLEDDAGASEGFAVRTRARPDRSQHARWLGRTRADGSGVCRPARFDRIKSGNGPAGRPGVHID
jgi:hypothetical protein